MAYKNENAGFVYATLLQTGEWKIVKGKNARSAYEASTYCKITRSQQWAVDNMHTAEKLTVGMLDQWAARAALGMVPGSPSPMYKRQWTLQRHTPALSRMYDSEHGWVKLSTQEIRLGAAQWRHPFVQWSCFV